MNAYKKHIERLKPKEKFAIWVSDHVGTMECAAIFGVIGIGSIVGIVINNAVLGLVCGAVSSYFLQLVLLPVIMVGQNLQNKHSELRAELDLQTDLQTNVMLERIEKKLDDYIIGKKQAVHKRPRR